MPNSLNDLATRVSMMLQDEDHRAWQVSEVIRELDNALMHLARRHLFAEFVWINSVQHQSLYPLNEQAIFLLAGLDNGGGTDNLTTLNDSTANFTATVIIGDRVKNLTDGSSGIITTVNATSLVCLAGFTGGQENAVDTGDRYVVERPLVTLRIVSVDGCLYDGVELPYATEDRLDRLTPGWELRRTGPKYWSVDSTETPSVLRVHPPPLVTGSSVPVFPMDPLPQRWQENFIVVLSDHPQQTIDAAEEIHLLQAYEDAVVWDAVSRMSSWEGEFQNPSLSTVAGALAQLVRQRLNIS